ncbi:family 43 glycosylhydrolase [Stakelama saccharophila]|uniref:Family 43 glycosylhydrolase n=1 Tax=Stakelama saccharophila TaxID=3075605 RepID=A0ABZ0B7M4_9SPHN|nr:family 43 glycosylhydrolase [Stakelama sp. W311]WNO53421.1 family 43 glycosylhydrolase [Stakelama sp. W311]
MSNIEAGGVTAKRTKRMLLAAVMAAGIAGAAQARDSVFDGADPSAMVVDDTVYLYPTHDGETLSAWASDDLEHWRREGPLLDIADIDWIDDDGARFHALWAPDMVAANGKYFFYYAVGPQNPTPSRIGVAICDTPTGPCRDSGKPLVGGGDGFEAIDPMVYVDPASGRRLLYAGGSAGSTLRLWELADDMVTVARRVPVNQPPHFTEGAFMHRRDGRYYLSYSHGRYNDASYQVHYATADSPTGPWRYQGVLLKSDDRYKGPGHHAFFKSPIDGRWWIAYHRWEDKDDDGPYRGSRRVVVQPIEYDAAGRITPVDMER